MCVCVCVCVFVKKIAKTFLPLYEIRCRLSSRILQLGGSDRLKVMLA